MFRLIDVSYNIPPLPDPGDPLDFQGANAIELNLFALIRAWPAFETVTILGRLGSYGYLDIRDNETATPADGISVELIQHLPRLLVLLDGDGLANIRWSGGGWAEESPGTLVYQLKELSAASAMSALRALTISAVGDADIIVTLAAENLLWEPDGLRLVGQGQTRLLFRGRATWGLARAKKHTWGGAKPLTWGETAALRKG